ncbi:hypothetical protein EAE99_003861 [Botrytis elliptica]|nr:hypothetical protein EAE99_003861 [Botrytis elliptica]
MSTINLPLKRTALEMVRETELDGPLQKVREALIGCQNYINSRTQDLEYLEQIVMDRKSKIEREEEEIRRIEEKLVIRRKDLRCAEQALEEYRAETSGLKEKEKLLLVAQGRGEEFLKKLLKAGKVELDAMIQRGLDEAESSSKKRIKVESKENEGDV